jgi:hypothetical protein
VFLDKESGLASAYYEHEMKLLKRHPGGFLHPDEMKQIFDRITIAKIVFYQQKILNLLFPNNFANWYFAGMNKVGEIGSQRELVLGTDLIKYKDSSEIIAIEGKLKAAGLRVAFDLVGNNTIKDTDDNLRYIDEPSIFVNSSVDIDKLVRFVDTLEISDKEKNEYKKKIIAWGKRIIQIFKESYKIGDGRIVLKS